MTAGIDDVSVLIEESVEEMKEYVNGHDIGLVELERLLEAEKGAKNRKTAIEFLERKIDEKEEESTVGSLKVERFNGRSHLVLDIDGIDFEVEDSLDLNFLGGNPDSRLETVHTKSGDRIKMSAIQEATGTETQEKEEDVRSRQEAESKQEKEDVEEESESESSNTVMEDLNRMEEKLKEWERLKQELIEKHGIEKERLEGKDIEELEELKEELAGKSDPAEKLKEEDHSPDELEGKEAEELKELEEKDDLIRTLSGYGMDEEELEDASEEDLRSLKNDLERKQELVDELDIEVDEGDLTDVDIGFLEGLKEEKERREELIQKLIHEDLGEEELRNSSTEDLERLVEEVENGDGAQHQLLENDIEKIREELERGKDIDCQALLEQERNGENRNEVIELLREKMGEEEEKYYREAEEDLEMLMGARDDQEDEEDEEKNLAAAKKMKELKEDISGSWKNITPEKDSKESTNRKKKVLKFLKGYEDLPEEEAAVKTAHLMKGFLEYILGIDRELTYGELADELRETEKDSESLEELVEFFQKMQEEQYVGHINVSDYEFLEASRKVVKQLG